MNRKVVGDESKIAVGQVLQNPVGKIRGSDYMLMVTLGIMGSRCSI